MRTEASALKFYQKLITEDLQRSLLESSVELDTRSGIYTEVVTIWLMIFQRLNPDKSLAGAVEKLKSGYFEDILDLGSIRVRERRISSNTGGYSKARNKLDLSRVEQAADAINQSLDNITKEERERHQKLFLIDGSTLKISSTAKNKEKYPQYYNQHGVSHFPLVKYSVATNAHTGVSMRPSFGAYNGSEATNELDLGEEVILRLPKGSIVLGDRYYGCPRFAESVKEAGHDYLCRIKEYVAKKYIGSPESGSGEKSVLWETNNFTTKKTHRVEGKFIWCTIERKGFRPVKLVLFTTLDITPEEAASMYGLRWNVELDIRDIKSTLGMGMIHAKSPEMLAKELVLGFVAYNLVRHLLLASAHTINVNPRELSYARMLKRINAAYLAAAFGVEHRLESHTVLNTLLCDAASLKLPKRKKKRLPEPRKVLQKGRITFMTRSREEERADIINNLKKKTK